MSEIGQYLLSIVAAAVIVAVSNTMIESKGAIGSIIKFITGLALAMIVVSPWSDFQISEFDSIYASAETEAVSVASEGQQLSQNKIAELINQQLLAYILDKAAVLGLDVSVDVILSDETPPSICNITIVGAVSPYAKKRLTQILCKDLGVTEECLIWS